MAVVGGLFFVLAWVLLDRVVNPFLARRAVRKLMKDTHKHDPQALEDPKYGTLSEDADFLRIKTHKGDTSEIRWSEIEEIHAFKKDLFTRDLICLAFKRAGKDDYYEIHEEMAGYHGLLQLLPSRLSGFNSDWFSAVAFPAFETKHQIIWKKSPKILQIT